MKDSKNWGTLIAAGSMALVLLILTFVFLRWSTGEAAAPPPDEETEVTTRQEAEVTVGPDQPVAVVNGEEIARNTWLEAVLVDHVVSRLAGIPTPAPEETLERMINGTLVLQEAPSIEPPSDAELERYVEGLERTWNISDAQLTLLLERVGIGRSALKATISRLLVIQRAQESIDTGEEAFNDWLSRQREDAEIEIYEERASIGNLTLVVEQAFEDVAQLPASSPTPPIDPTPTPSPAAVVVPEVAPDFTLERANGEMLTLTQQLAEGPVVLVFFQKCG
jgi:hypothetical protein